MKKLHFISALMALTFLCLINSCSKDDEEFDEDVKTENLSGQDPEGTIILNMQSGSDGNYYKIGELGEVHLDAANNFRGKDLGYGYYKIEFVTIGKVDGLSKITNIPISGWAESAAVVSGTGYVMRYTPGQWEGGNVIYTRIYVVDYLTTATTDEFGITTGNNSGAIIKYQTPFQLPIKVDKSSLFFDSEADTQILLLENPTTVKIVSKPDWCEVTINENIIVISVKKNLTAEQRQGEVVLSNTTSSVKISVIQDIASNGGGNPSSSVSVQDLYGAWYGIDENTNNKINIFSMYFFEHGDGVYSELKARADKNNWEPYMEEPMQMMQWTLQNGVLVMTIHISEEESIERVVDILKKDDDKILVRRHLGDGETDVITIYRINELPEAWTIIEKLVEEKKKSNVIT